MTVDRPNPVDVEAIRRTATFRPLWWAELVTILDDLVATRRREDELRQALERVAEGGWIRSHVPSRIARDALAALAPAPPTEPGDG